MTADERDFHRSKAPPLWPRRVAATLLPPARGRRITLHIGPHKTGTTTIQKLLADNRRALAPRLCVVHRNDPLLRALAEHSWQIDTEAELLAARPLLADHARALARSVRHHRHALISHEDILGKLPTRNRLPGLYPLGPEKLARMVAAMEETGARVDVVFYRRDFRLWLESLVRHRRLVMQDDWPKWPGAMRKRFGLPSHWQGTLDRIADVLPPGRLTVLDFQADCAGPGLGTALLRHCGLPNETMATLTWPEPQRVTRPLDRGAGAQTGTRSQR